jgi:hypothetical protein
LGGGGLQEGGATGTQPYCSSVYLVFCVLYVREGRKEEGDRRRKRKGRKKRKNIENFPNLKISEK